MPRVVRVEQKQPEDADWVWETGVDYPGKRRSEKLRVEPYDEYAADKKAYEIENSDV